ncbi:hypothetical protein GCM10007086_18940 [Photobacterium aphoticum]|nr:hypothetical protein GCM10007086_18940 [Photobacterium aphoticum]
MEFCADSFGHGNDYTPESEGWQVPLRMGLYATLNEVKTGNEAGTGTRKRKRLPEKAK